MLEVVVYSSYRLIVEGVKVNTNIIMKAGYYNKIIITSSYICRCSVISLEADSRVARCVDDH